jgi:hypothetical protein
MDHDGNLRHLVYNMDKVHSLPASAKLPLLVPVPGQAIISIALCTDQAVRCMDEANGIGKMVVVLDCHNYRRAAPSLASNHYDTW